MNRSIKESDWKLFKSISKSALDKYCKESLQRVHEFLAEADAESFDTTSKIFDFMKSRRKLQSSIFDDYRRSTASHQLILMAREGLLEESEMSNLSEELKKQISVAMTI